MNGIILIGTNDLKEKYLDEFIKKQDIPIYNVNRCTEDLKINDAREIIRKLSISTDRKRVYIVDNEPGIEAQNALLKTLEEMPDRSYIIFCGEQELIPTITSRCKVEILRPKGKKIEIGRDDAINFGDSLARGAFDRCLVLLDTVLLNGDMKDVIVGVRKIMISDFDKFEEKEIIRLADFLKASHSKYLLVLNNNLNQKLALEAVLSKVCEK